MSPGAGSLAFLVMALCSVIAVLLVAPMFGFRLRVDAHGVLLRSWCGLPHWSVPLGQIESATVKDASALGDYCGWGIRFIPGSTAVVLWSGPVLVLERSNKRALVVSTRRVTKCATLIRAYQGSRVNAREESLPRPMEP